MALEPVQQLQKILTESKNVLIFLPQNPNGDAIGAGWAFYFFLKKKGIETTIAFGNETGSAEKYQFLPQPENLTHNISGARDFMISFNTKYNKIMNIKTETENEEFKIFITPEHGSIDPRDFSFIPAKFKYDLVIALGCPDKESVGKLYEENADMFYEIPVVNIDYHSTNDNFGQINLVSLTSSSVCEILAETLEQIDPYSLDDKIAESLLTGIISATESFQKKNTTPKALQVAAKLMDKGADQQKIVRYLYKTQPFNVLKLWGRVMARLKWDEELKLVWAPVLLEDFVQSRSKPIDLPFILEKIKDNYSAGRFFMVYYKESDDVIGGMIKCPRNGDAEKIAKIFNGQVFQDIVKFKIENQNMAEVEQEIIAKLKTINGI